MGLIMKQSRTETQSSGKECQRSTSPPYIILTIHSSASRKRVLASVAAIYNRKKSVEKGLKEDCHWPSLRADRT